ADSRTGLRGRRGHRPGDVARLAGGEPRRIARGLAGDLQEVRRDAAPPFPLRRRCRGGALLRLDRQPREQARRRPDEAALHAPQAPQPVVGAQQAPRRGAAGAGADDAGGARQDRGREAGRVVGGARRGRGAGGAARPAGRAGGESGRRRQLRRLRPVREEAAAVLGHLRQAPRDAGDAGRQGRRRGGGEPQPPRLPPEVRATAGI
ncbi:MAG: hypothetical protein AVDCRST_MAG49-2089, partial [uncultured Thermomicrobiales bacterium]